MKVLVISRHSEPTVGGTERFVSAFLRLTNLFPGLSVNAVLLEQPGGRIDPPSDRVNLSYVRVPFLFKFLYVFRSGENVVAGAIGLSVTAIALAIRGYREMRRDEADVIYAIGGPIALIAGLLIKFFTHKPLVVHFHWLYRYADAGWPVRVLVGFLYRRADALIGNCPRFCTDAIALGVKKERVFGIFNWVDERFRPIGKDRSPLQARYGIRPDDAVLLFVGRLDWSKQSELVIQALHKSTPGVVVMVAGTGALSEKLLEVSRINPMVRVLGDQDSDALIELYNLADALLWGSVDLDYPSLVIMEAMCCGLPVFTSRVTMNSMYSGQIIDASGYGAPKYVFLYPPTLDGVAEAIVDAARRKDQSNAMRQEISEFARPLFGIENAKQILRVLVRVAKTKEGLAIDEETP